MGIFVVLTLLLASPIIALLVPYLTSGAFAVAQQASSIENSMEWSDNLASFFLPSYCNGIFNGIAKSSYLNIYYLTYNGIQYSLNVGEKVSYIGYSVLLLVLLGIYFDYRRSRLKNSLIWIVILVIFGDLALGPYIQFGTAISGIPTLYMAFRHLPILNIIREPGRFDFIVTIALAVIAAIGFTHLTQGKDRKTALTYLAVFAAIILIEYNGMPLTASYINNSTTSAAIPAAYSEIGQYSGNFSVLILPALPNYSNTPARWMGLATYYVTALRKPIIGGYTSRKDSNQTLSVTAVPIAITALYLEEGYGLVYPSPLSENLTALNLLWLANYNTAFVGVTRQAFNISEQNELMSYLYSMFGPGSLVYVDNSTVVFSTQNAIYHNAGKSIVAYTVGNWTMGYDFCSVQCNSTFASMWWGPSLRELVVFSPKIQNTELSFSAMAFSNVTPVSLYLGNSKLETIPLYPYSRNYSINVTLPQGSSVLSFYSSAVPSEQPYLTYGVENITFTAK